MGVLEQFGAGDRVLPRQRGAVANHFGTGAGSHARPHTGSCADTAGGSDAARTSTDADARGGSAADADHLRAARHRDGATAAAPSWSRAAGAGRSRARNTGSRDTAGDANHNAAGLDAALRTARHHHQRADPADADTELRRRVLHATRRHVIDVRARHQPADPARLERFPRARAGERRRHRRRLGPEPGPRGADRSAGDPEDRNLSRARGAALRVAGDRRHRRGDQQPYSDHGAVRRRRGRTEGRPQQRRQRLGERAAARRRLAQRGDPCRRLRTPHQQLLDPELSVPLSAGSRAGGERAAAELVAHRRERIGRRLVAVRRRLRRRRGQPLHHRLPDPRPRSLRAAVAHPAGADQDHQQGRIPAVVFAGLRRPLLGRLHRLQAPRTRTQRYRLRADRRHVSQPREGGQDRGRDAADVEPIRRMDQLLRRAGEPSATRHLGRSAAVPGPYPGRSRLLVQRDRTHAHNCVRSSRSASRTSRSTAPRSIFRRTSCRRPTIRRALHDRSASPPRA